MTTRATALLLMVALLAASAATVAAADQWIEVAIEPLEASHRLRGAHVLLRQGKPAEARAEAEAALTVADSDDQRREAQELRVFACRRGQR